MTGRHQKGRNWCVRGLFGTLLVSVLGAGMLGHLTLRRDRCAGIEEFIGDLYVHQWFGPQLPSTPGRWLFNLTDPMKRIIAMGPAAQNDLLPKVSDPQIKDQVITLLGAVGDERAVGPVIDAMIPADRIPTVPNARRTNLCANLALTNITTAEVAYGHQSGGPLFWKCSQSPKECWEKWWLANKDTFTVGHLTAKDRDYGYYPNYGIYEKEGLRPMIFVGRVDGPEPAGVPLPEETAGQVGDSIDELIAALYTVRWRGAAFDVDAVWDEWVFYFTDPMRRILEKGPAAQRALLTKLSDTAIECQVIILLGGLGDERAIGPIIESMVPVEQVEAVPNAGRINLYASLALANLTAQDVRWPYHGDLVFQRWPNAPKTYWASWWARNKATFRVANVTDQDRSYPSYPNYGTYRRKAR